jgi:hypothetical protein
VYGVFRHLKIDMWRSCGGLRCLDLATVTSLMAALVSPLSLMTLSGDIALRVDPDSGRAALTRRVSSPRLRCGVAAAWGEVFLTADAAQVDSVLTRLARSASGRRLRIQPLVGEGLLDDLPL